MSYADFAWKDLMEAAKRDHRRRRREPRAVFVSGVPAAFMSAGEAGWSWRVKSAVKHPLGRPHLRFAIAPGRRRAGLDDLCQLVLDAVAPGAVTVWAEVGYAETTGVRIADVAPPFPPRIDRILDLETDPRPERRARLAEEVSRVRALRGDEPLGAHLTLGKVAPSDFGYRSPVRLLFDAPSPVLGGTPARPGDLRIRDLRVVRDSRRASGAEIRLWTLRD